MPKDVPQQLPDHGSNTPERYAIVRESLLTDKRLTGEELRLLLKLGLSDLPDWRNGGKRKGYVFVSRERLAEELGCTPRQIRRLLQSLEDKGFIKREGKGRKATRIEILVRIYPDVNSPLNEILPDAISPLNSTDPEQKRPLYLPEPDVNSPHEADVKRPHKNIIEDKKLRDLRATSSMSVDSAIAPSQNSVEVTRKKPMEPKTHKPTVEDVQTAIEGLDLAKFRTKYPKVDVQGEHERFANYYLGGLQGNGKPNWQKWSDWSRAFHTWLKTAGTFASNRPPNKPQPPAPAQLPSLDDFRL